MSLSQIVIFDSKFVPSEWEQEVREFIQDLRKYNSEEEIEHMLQGETVADVESNISTLYTCMNCENSMREEAALVFQNAKTTLYQGVLCNRCLTDSRRETAQFMRVNHSEMLPQYIWDKEEVPWKTFMKYLRSFLRQSRTNSQGKQGRDT